MQIRAEKCNPSLKLGRAPIGFRTKQQKKKKQTKKQKTFPVLTERLLRASKIHCVKELWRSVTVSMEE